MVRHPAAIVTAVVLVASVGAARAADQTEIGFVTHAQGNPFIQQIVDGAQAAATALGVTLRVAQEAGGDSGSTAPRRAELRELRRGRCRDLGAGQIDGQGAERADRQR